MSLLVNGPVNTVRLEGSVGSNKKVVYLFMDFHAPVCCQKKCPDIRATDVNTFLVEEFDRAKKSNPDQTFDFMFERSLFRPLHHKNKKLKYIGEIDDLFSKAFKLDIETNKAQKSDLVPNVRFHHVDVRDFINRISWNVYYDQIAWRINDIYHSLDYNQNQLSALFYHIQVIQSEFATLYVLLYKNHNLFNPKIEKSLYSAHISKMHTLPEKDNYKLVQKLVYKLLVEYKHESVKKIITEIINTEFHEIFINFLNWIDDILSFLTTEIDLLIKIGDHNLFEILFQQSDRTYSYGMDQSEYWKKILKIYDISNDLDNKIATTGLYLMDLYKLRRILDKDYVTNVISYAGASHSNNYIRLLIKYFGFKLTHYSYLKNNNIKETEKIVKSSKNLDDLNILFYPFVIGQCSDLSSFPKLFS